MVVKFIVLLSLVSWNLALVPVKPQNNPKKNTQKNTPNNTQASTVINNTSSSLSNNSLTSGLGAGPTQCVPVGATCSTESGSLPCCMFSTCDKDNTCRIMTDNNCTLGTNECVLGSVCTFKNSANPVCAVCSASGADCTADRDCCQPPDAGLTQAQSCQYSIISKSHKCLNCNPIGMSCNTSDNCCSGAVCYEHTCMACIAAGQTCSKTETNTCCDGYSCQNGICKTCQEFGGSCSSDVECCQDSFEQFCQDNKCTMCIENGAKSDGESRHCCQYDVDRPQVSLNGICTNCSKLCGDCTKEPCCDGYSCTGNKCCAQLDMPCVMPDATQITNPCLNSGIGTTKTGDTGCCENLVCKLVDPSQPNIGKCQACAILGASCNERLDCCQSRDNLICKDHKCALPELCDLLDARYNTGIKSTFININQAYPISTTGNMIEPGPCETAYWAYFYNLELLMAYYWAIAPEFADMQCSNSVTQQIQAKMEHSLRIMEAVCYNNSTPIGAKQLACLNANPMQNTCLGAETPQVQCGMPPIGTPSSAIFFCGAGPDWDQPITAPAANQTLPDYLAKLPPCLNISHLLANYIWKQACTKPELKLGGSCTQLPASFPALSSFSGGVAPEIFTAADIYHDLSIGTNNIMVPIDGVPRDNPNYNILQNLAQAKQTGNQVDLVDVINTVVSTANGMHLEVVLPRSNWANGDSCTCWNGQEATYQPAINLHPEHIQDACVCKDPTKICSCDPEPNGAGGYYAKKDPVIDIYYDGSGCSGNCWNGVCACSKDSKNAVDSTCYGVFTGVPSCPLPETKCTCADGSTCSCLNKSGIDLSGTIDGTCNTVGIVCAPVDAAGLSIPGAWQLPNQTCTTGNTCAVNNGCTDTIKMLIGGKLTTVSRCRGINNTDNYSCKFDNNNKPKCCCEKDPAINPTGAACPEHYLLKTQTHCVCQDGQQCVPPALPQPPVCTPACPDLKYGCCYDGSQDGNQNNPDCIAHNCCLNVVNQAIQKNAQAIADNLNAILFLTQSIDSMPTDYLGNKCPVADWTLTVEQALITKCNLHQALSCMNTGECDLAQKCTDDTVCGGCACDKTTSLCVGCVPIGHGCAGQSSMECCGDGVCDLTTGLCVADCVQIGHGCAGLSDMECCGGGACDLTTKLCAACIPPNNSCSEAAWTKDMCCQGPDLDDGRKAWTATCANGKCAQTLEPS